MEMYLMRHGEAVPRSEWEGSDSSRPLSKEGKADLERAARGMARGDCSFELILCSPYQRAKETATLVASCRGQGDVLSLPDLAAGARPDAIQGALNPYLGKAPFLIVGHIPDLALFAARLTGKMDLWEGGLAPGEVVALETGSPGLSWGQGTILWRRKLEEW
ncbi:MAG: phosphohistidine phosphatase SixA [Elusimicrobia bacterium]|nr:phosphohistidine phosphatase SixA [Candidatus Obscuribacterium magneticum]